MFAPSRESALEIRREGGRRRVARRGLAVAAVLASVISMTGVAAASPPHPHPGPGQLDLGPNVIVFDPTMPTAQIQSTIDAISAQQVSNQFGDERYALLFKPGTYGTPDAPLIFQVGYYTEVAGLGESPNDVTINGTVDVYNQCLTPDNCTALVNFWRSMSNLTINVAGGSGCQTATEFWAVSQAAPMRRVNINGNVSLMDYCSAGPQYASGGFIADSAFSAGIVNGSQQQFFVRNSSIGGAWSNAVWNQVFAGVQGAPAQSFPSQPYTTLATTPASREAPYLYVDSHNNVEVFVPAAQQNSSGTSWASGHEKGKSISIRDFYVAKPSDSVRTINLELALGKNLIFTPGVYNVGSTIEVTHPDTVVLGLGMATLEAQNGAVAMRVADVKGVDISGLIFDAGPKNSPVLLQVGTPDRPGRGKLGGLLGGLLSLLFGHGHGGSVSDRNDPTALQDVFFRIGGEHVGKATVSLEVNSDNVILDDIWAWRADHGTGVGWTVNTADSGLVVNGDDVTATGLFVEHYQKYEVLWNGENGKTVFFQNEMPYDPPTQADWQHHGVDGYAAFKVTKGVKTFEGWGMGSYCFFNVNPAIHAYDAYEVPVTPGVKLHDILTLQLNTDIGVIDHVVNGYGPATAPASVIIPVVEYPVS